MRITRRQLRQIIKEEVINEQSFSPPPMDGPLENLASDVLDMMQNAVGQTDLNYSDDPLTYEDILDFVARMLHSKR